MDELNESSSKQRPIIRWSVVIWGAAAISVGIGYVSGRVTTKPIVEKATAVPLQTEPAAKSEPAASAKNSLPDPERPRPQSTDNLIHEVRQAVDYLNKAFPATPDALEMKARIEKWLGHTADAVVIWDQCLALDPNYIHAHVGKAQTAADKGEHEQAVELARQAIAIEPLNFQARYVLADSLIHLRRPADAIPVLKESLKSDPRSLGYYELGQAYFDLKQFELARDQLEAAIKKYPEYSDAYYLLSRTYRQLGDELSAKRHLAEYQKLAQAPKDPRSGSSSSTDFENMIAGAAVIYTDSGTLLMVRSREADAEVFWRRAAQLDAKNVACRQSLAFLDRNQNRLGETICWFKELAGIEPTNISYWIEMGRLYEELNALPAAEKSFRKVCELAPNRADGYFSLADLFLRHDRNPPETQSLAQKAVEYNPLPQHYALLAAACQANGDNRRALTAIENAIELAPQSASYRAVRDAIKKEIGVP